MIALCTILTAWTGVRMLVWTPLFVPAVVANANAGVAWPVQPGGPAVAPLPAAAWQNVAITPDKAQRRAKPAAWAAYAGSAAQVAPFNLTNFASYTLPKGKVRSPVKAVPSFRPTGGGEANRWSGDGWLLLRGSGGSTAQAPGAASYGASQAGAVVRYRLGAGGMRDGYVYMRTSFAIDAPGSDREAALGLGVRPVASLPLRALVEARVQDSSTGSARARPVAAVVTELPWQELPLGLRGEAYAQAGYAGGRGATAFFDAQTLIDHAVTGIVPRHYDVRVGAGVWVGGQKDATRFDIGPRIAVGLDLARHARARVALDWRIRVGGNARPGSGPALTLASSF